MVSQPPSPFAFSLPRSGRACHPQSCAQGCSVSVMAVTAEPTRDLTPQHSVACRVFEGYRPNDGFATEVAGLSESGKINIAGLLFRSLPFPLLLRTRRRCRA